jgi:hypothetical protein
MMAVVFPPNAVLASINAWNSGFCARGRSKGTISSPDAAAMVAKLNGSPSCKPS